MHAYAVNFKLLVHPCILTSSLTYSLPLLLPNSLFGLSHLQYGPIFCEINAELVTLLYRLDCTMPFFCPT